MSQPSLSSTINHLEEELGIPIILRHQKFQGFTEEGKRIVEWSKRLLADRQAMEILHEEALKSFKLSSAQADFVEAYSKRQQ